MAATRTCCTEVLGITRPVVMEVKITRARSESSRIDVSNSHPALVSCHVAEHLENSNARRQFSNNLKTALQNHNKISDLVGFYFTEFDGKGPCSNLEHEHGQTDGRKWPKSPGWRRRDQYFVNGAMRQEPEAAKLSWIGPGAMADHLRTGSGLSWTFRTARVTTIVSTTDVFRRLFDQLPVQILAPDNQHWSLQKKLSDQSFWFWSALFL